MTRMNSITPPPEGMTHYTNLAAPLVNLGLMQWHGNTLVITLSGDALIAVCLKIPALKARHIELCKEATEFAARAAILSSFIEHPVLFMLAGIDKQSRNGS